MREIQDMTLNVARGLEGLERRLSERSERFAQEFGVLKTPEEAFGIRLTAVPVGDEIGFDRVFRRHQVVEGLEEPWRLIARRKGDSQRTLRANRSIPTQWRPILRGARADVYFNTSSTDRMHDTYREIHCDGLIELGDLSCPEEIRGTTGLYLSPIWLFELLANLIAQADRLRRQAGAPVAEYAIEVEINVRRRPVIVSPDVNSSLSGRLLPRSKKFPRYLLGDAEGVPRLLELFRRDFWNYLGKDFGDEEGSLTIQDWPSQD